MEFVELAECAPGIGDHVVHEMVDGFDLREIVTVVQVFQDRDRFISLWSPVARKTRLTK
jgi:hypothetical protein